MIRKRLTTGCMLCLMMCIVSGSIPFKAHCYVDDIRVTPVVKAVKSTQKAVVNISTHEQVYERTNPFSSFGNNPFFDRFFNDFFDQGYRKKSVRTHLGSGVIIDERGYIVTNWHVIEKAASITITTEDEKEYEASLIGADPKSDLAVLKISSQKNFTKVPLGTSDNLYIGETVIAIGNPFGLSHTVTTGVVSAVNRSIKANEQVYENFIQTDASINPGNSGGPLLNINGELIGINTAIYGQAEGIGFAIPINTVKRIVDDLLEFGEVRVPWIGISVQEIDPGIAAHFKYPESYGVIVSEIFPNSPAAKSGLQSADIIMSIADKKIKTKTAYKRTLSLYTADDVLTIKLFRQGAVKKLRVKASEFPFEYVDTLLWENFGFRIIDNSRAIARRYGLYTAEGVVLSEVHRNGQAHQRGLKPGDVIVKVQVTDIKDSTHLKKQLVKNIHLDSIVLLVQRGQYGYYITMDM